MQVLETDPVVVCPSVWIIDPEDPTPVGTVTVSSTCWCPVSRATFCPKMRSREILSVFTVLHPSIALFYSGCGFSQFIPPFPVSDFSSSFTACDKDQRDVVQLLAAHEPSAEKNQREAAKSSLRTPGSVSQSLRLILGMPIYKVKESPRTMKRP
jgi:hypothetical protein